MMPTAVEPNKTDGTDSGIASPGDEIATENKINAASIELVTTTDTSSSCVVRIIFPTGESTEAQIGSLELVQEIHQLISDREESCHRTCFSLQVKGQVLDNFCELKQIENLKENCEIHLIEEPYSTREAKNHFKHIHDLLRSVDLSDAYVGKDNMSLSFVNLITTSFDDSNSLTPDVVQRLLQESIPPSYILPYKSRLLEPSPALAAYELPQSYGSNFRLTPLHPLEKDSKPPSCLKQLIYSNWNPPQGPRVLHGDLVYIYLHTLEDKVFHITGCVKGFYVNQSTDSNFNPRPVSPNSHLSHSLIDLIRQVSPLFKRNFELLLKKRSVRHPLERVACPFQVHTWLSPVLEHYADCIRKEEAFCSKMAYEENLPGQTREWNEELQATRELTSKKLLDRVIRDRAAFKTNSDFVATATRAAVSVVLGNIMAINPGEHKHQKMFIWNNIFFSLGFDVKNHYEKFGGDAAAHVATANDLKGVKAYSSLDVKGLSTLGTVIIDYAGYRVTGQTIIPGILEREQEQSVVYGSYDFGKHVASDKKYCDLLMETADMLKLRPHKVFSEPISSESSKDVSTNETENLQSELAVVTHNGDSSLHDNENSEPLCDKAKMSTVQLYSSVECKGIIGNDQRYYILDLLRFTPPDVHYLGCLSTSVDTGGVGTVDKTDLSGSMQAFGYPYAHTHKLSNIRQEAVESFVEKKYLTFLRNVSDQVRDLKADKKAKLENSVIGDKIDEAKKLVESYSLQNGEGVSDESYDTAEIIKKAAVASGSCCDSKFCISFNPDIFQYGVTSADSEDEIATQKKHVVEICEFVVSSCIPKFIEDCADETIVVYDGTTLVEALHQRGINVRYLNRIIEESRKKEALFYLTTILISEILIRCAKHIFCKYVRSIDPMKMSLAISHFLNCFLSSCVTPLLSIASDDISKTNTKGRKNKKKLSKTKDSQVDWSALTPTDMWLQLGKEAIEYYHFDLESQSIDEFCSKTDSQRISLLCHFCKSVGIQLALRDYAFDAEPVSPRVASSTSGSKVLTATTYLRPQTFHDEDIMNLLPRVKHLSPQASDASSFLAGGQSRIAQGNLSEGHELISEALNLLNQIYGPLHGDISSCNRLLAKLSYIMSDYKSAFSYQYRATIIAERVFGVDAACVASEYNVLGLYSFSCGEAYNALQYIYRARHIAMLCHGELHPEIAVFDTNIGLVLLAIGEYKHAVSFFDSSMQLCSKFYGSKSLKVALSMHLLAEALSSLGDFKNALSFEKQCFLIYKEKLGKDNDRTKESGSNLSRLTEQAVKLAKRVNEIASISRGSTDDSAFQSSSLATALSSYEDNCNSPQVFQILAMADLYPGGKRDTSSFSAILDTLNLVNGIYFIQLSSLDVEKCREEIAKRTVNSVSGNCEAALLNTSASLLSQKVKKNP